MDLAAVKKRVLAGFAWQGMTKLIVQIASWGTTLFVARIISPSEYGIVAAAGVFTELLIILTELGLAQGLIQKPSLTSRERDGAFFVSLALGLAAYVVLFLAAPLIARFYQMPVLTEVVRVSALAVVFGSLKTVPLAIAMRRMNFRYRSLVEMGGTLMMTLSVILMAVSGYGIWSLVWGPVIGHFVMICAYLPLMGRLPRPRFSLADVTAPMRFGLKVTGTNLLYYVWSRADVAIIGKVLGERLLGIYSMAFQLAVLPLDKIGFVFTQVMFPALARLQHDLKASQDLFIQQHRNLVLVAYPVLFGLALVADDAVLLLLTEKWLPIVPYLRGLCAVSALRISGMLMPPTLYARGKPELVLRYSGLAAVLLPLAILVGAQFGLGGVVAAWIACYPVLYVVLGRYCLRDLELSWSALLRPLLPVAVATVAMTGAVAGFKAVAAELELVARLAGSVAIGALVYGGVLGVFFKDRLGELWTRLLVLRRGEASG